MKSCKMLCNKCRKIEPFTPEWEFDPEESKWLCPKCSENTTEKEGEMELSKNQIALMKHTVSEPNRNWFGTGLETSDSNEFERLVEAGYATKEEAASWMGDDVIYRLTDKGKEALEGK